MRRRDGADDSDDHGEEEEDHQLAHRDAEADAEILDRERRQPGEEDPDRGAEHAPDERRDDALVADHPAHLGGGGADRAQRPSSRVRSWMERNRLLAIPNIEMTMLMASRAMLAENADAVEQYRAGDEKERKKKRGFLFGQVMSATDRKGNPQLINQLLDDRLK